MTGYELVFEHVPLDKRDLAWGSMTYACVDKAKAAQPVPASWDNIVANAPAGYWEERGGIPETIEINGERCFPAEPDGCGHEEIYFLCVGVEGPSELMVIKAFVPCPFVAGKCPACGRSMTHVRWGDDEIYDELQPVPAGANYFHIPDVATAARFAEQGYGGAQLSTKAAATEKVYIVFSYGDPMPITSCKTAELAEEYVAALARLPEGHPLHTEDAIVDELPLLDELPLPLRDPESQVWPPEVAA